MVANELGFRQTIPQKRDSVVEDQVLLAPAPQTNGVKLAVPQSDISHSASPILEPMSARISDDAARMLQALDLVEDPPLLRMSARVAIAS